MKRLILLWRVIKLLRNWPLYFVQRYSLSKKNRFNFKLRNGFSIMTRHFAVDRSALHDVWLENTYDPNAFGLPFDWSTSTSIIDVGANIGDFVIFAASKAPNAHIICLEPEAGNFLVLQENIRMNHLENRVTAVAEGAASENGTTQLFLNEESSGGHSAFAYDKTTAATTMKLRSFSEVLAMRNGTYDFVKIDCEGGEYDILYHLTDAEFARMPFIAVEYHHFSQDPTHDGPHLKQFLEERGYTVMSPMKSIFYAYRPESR